MLFLFFICFCCAYSAYLHGALQRVVGEYHHTAVEQSAVGHLARVERYADLAFPTGLQASRRLFHCHRIVHRAGAGDVKVGFADILYLHAAHNLLRAYRGEVHPVGAKPQLRCGGIVHFLWMRCHHLRRGGYHAHTPAVGFDGYLRVGTPCLVGTVCLKDDAERSQVAGSHHRGFGNHANPLVGAGKRKAEGVAAGIVGYHACLAAVSLPHVANHCRARRKPQTAHFLRENPPYGLSLGAHLACNLKLCGSLVGMHSHMLLERTRAIRRIELHKKAAAVAGQYHRVGKPCRRAAAR